MVLLRTTCAFKNNQRYRTITSSGIHAMNDYATIVAMRIKLLRVRRRLSQQQLAEKVNLSQSYTGRIGGASNLTLGVLCALASALSVAPARLLEPLEVLDSEAA